MHAEGLPQPAIHGGDLAAIAQRYDVARDSLTDFSANLNPLGPPRSLLRALARAALDRDALSRYPDTSHAGLTLALATRHNVDPASIVVGNGAAALLDAAVRVRRIERCLVPQPSFSEDRRALDAAGVRIVPFALARADGFALPAERVVDAMERESCDAVLITNPHNPSGSIASREEIARVVTFARSRGAIAIVDEAFADFAPAASIVDLAASLNDTIVVRSLTKFFAVPDLRAGYAVCAPDLATRLRALLPSWPVSNMVASAFVAALADDAYARRSLAYNLRERERLTRRLRVRGFGAIACAANFLLVELPAAMPHAATLVAWLIVRERLVLRDCSSYAGLEDGRFVRIAVRTRGDNDRLVRALERAKRDPDLCRNASVAKDSSAPASD